MTTLHHDMQIDSELEEDGIENEEISEEPRLNPFNPNDIDIRDQKLTIESLVKRLKNNRIDLYPDYQRLPDLWDKGKQSRLIESVLIKIPLPAFFFDGSNEVWQVVDGLQRLSSIKNFVIGNEAGEKLLLQGLEYLKEWEGKGFDNLPQYLKERLEETNITAYIIHPGSPDEVKYNIFKRINTGGLTLKPQEIRNALNPGVPSKFIKELASIPEFKRLEIPVKRMLDLEYTTRFIAFYLNGAEYEPDWDTFLNKGLSDLKKLSIEERENIKHNFQKALQISYLIFRLSFLENKAPSESYLSNTKIKDSLKKKKNTVLFDVWIVNISKISDIERRKLESQKGKLIKEYAELWKRGDFNWAIRKNDKTSILYRFQAIKDLIHNVIYDN